MTDEPISEAMSLIVELAAAIGIERICDHPGCWHHKLDDNWEFAVNGHNKPCQFGDVTVPPFEAYVMWNGLPAGFIGVYGGVLAAGSAANEDTFIEALKEAIA
jgi:hypothetical protein